MFQTFLFQFLIGRLDTIEAARVKTYGLMFQFLIGRLDTGRLRRLLMPLERFQFLIGRLDTNLLWRPTNHLKWVSIPHR